MNLQITEAAKAALRRLIADSGLPNPYVTIVGGTDQDGGNWGWNVGLYARERISRDTAAPDWILELEGISFVIDAQWHKNLDGKCLDFVRGHFQVK